MQMMLNNIHLSIPCDIGASMTTSDEERRGPRSRLEAQIRLILHGIPGVVDPLEGAAAWPPDWAERGEVDYLYRQRTLLVRDEDVDRVRAIVPSVPRARVAPNNPRRGRPPRASTENKPGKKGALSPPVAGPLGGGVPPPPHISPLSPPPPCPATEPEEVPADAPPDPGVSTEPC